MTENDFKANMDEKRRLARLISADPAAFDDAVDFIPMSAMSMLTPLALVQTVDAMVGYALGLRKREKLAGAPVFISGLFGHNGSVRREDLDADQHK